MRKPPDKARALVSLRAPLKPIDLSKLKTYPLSRRQSKVRLADFSLPWQRGGPFKKFLETLPDILAVQDIVALQADADALVPWLASA